MNLNLLNANLCHYCSFPVQLCSCPKTNEKGGVITSIMEKALKKGKYITIVNGTLHGADFKKIKQKLGTGGSNTTQFTSFRGKVSRRVRILLSEMGYILP